MAFSVVEPFVARWTATASFSFPSVVDQATRRLSPIGLCAAIEGFANGVDQNIGNGNSLSRGVEGFYREFDVVFAFGSLLWIIDPREDHVIPHPALVTVLLLGGCGLIQFR